MSRQLKKIERTQFQEGMNRLKTRYGIKGMRDRVSDDFDIDFFAECYYETTGLGYEKFQKDKQTGKHIQTLEKNGIIEPT